MEKMILNINLIKIIDSYDSIKRIKGKLKRSFYSLHVTECNIAGDNLGDESDIAYISMY